MILSKAQAEKLKEILIHHLNEGQVESVIISGDADIKITIERSSTVYEIKDE